MRVIKHQSSTSLIQPHEKPRFLYCTASGKEVGQVYDVSTRYLAPFKLEIFLKIHMAEIGVIASIAGIVAAGTKLSVALFDFGSTIGSAGYEIRRIGSEISLFCAVLKQVQSKLRKSKATRYSLGAIQTTQEVLDECELVFKEIKSIIDSLTKEKLCSGRATIDWKSRIKWTFKRSQIQLQRTTLESCKITLNLMLITLDFDRKVASRRYVSRQEYQGFKISTERS